MSNDFNVSVDTSEETSGGKFILPGINRHPNFPALKGVTIYLKDIRFEDVNVGKSPNSQTLVMDLEDSEGRTLNYSIFKPTKSEYKTEEEKWESTKKIAANIMRVFVPEEKAVINIADSVSRDNVFPEFSRQLIAVVKSNPSFTTTPLRVKVILNSKDFPCLPGYAKIFENADLVSPEKSELVIKPEWNDRIERERAIPTSDAEVVQPAPGDDPF